MDKVEFKDMVGIRRVISTSVPQSGDYIVISMHTPDRKITADSWAIPKLAFETFKQLINETGVKDDE